MEGVTVVPLTTPPKAVHDPFKSGWDDTLKSAASLKKQTSFKSKVKVTPLRIPPPTLRFPSPTCSTSSVEEDSDASFAASTQNYLLSPTGKEALGRMGAIILSPMSQSAVDLDVHAESQQLIRKPTVSKVETVKLGKHLRPPSFGVPTTPEAFAGFVPLPGPTRPATQDFLSTKVRPQPPVEPPVGRVVRPSRSRENLSISAWPRPPTEIPLSPTSSPTRSPSRGMATPPPTFSLPPTPTAQGDSRDSYYDFIRQPSPTFPKMTITNRDRAYTFGTPFLPNVTHPPPPPPSRVSTPFQSLGITQASAVSEQEVRISKTPAPVLAKWESGISQVSWAAVIGGNANGSVDTNAVSPSMSSFIDSPSIYSTYSGNQPHPARMMHTSVVKETV